MIVLDESRLTYGTLGMILQDYDIQATPYFTEEYREKINKFVEEHQIDGEELVDKIVDVVIHGLKIVDISKNN
jgi:predicted nucleic acid-binding protein